MEEMDKEAYINDELTGEERIAFEAEMSRNPELEEEVKRMRQLIEDVEVQLLRSKIRTVLSDAPKPAFRNAQGGWWFLLAGLFLVFLFFYFALTSDRSAVGESISSENQVEQEQIEQQAPSLELFPEEETPANPRIEELETAQPKSSRVVPPVASNEKPSKGGISSPTVPQMRGDGQQDQNWQSMLDEIWYTTYPLPDHLQLGASLQQASSLLKARDFPKAYARLQILERWEGTTNDTLRFLKAYCLLEMRQGKEALIYLEGLGNQHPAWQIQVSWYEGLATLLTGDQEAAKELFSRIAADHNHPAQSYAEKAKRMLEKH